MKVPLNFKQIYTSYTCFLTASQVEMCTKSYEINQAHHEIEFQIQRNYLPGFMAFTKTWTVVHTCD